MTNYEKGGADTTRAGTAAGGQAGVRGGHYLLGHYKENQFGTGVGGEGFHLP